jgi:hypothetical protein
MGTWPPDAGTPSGTQAERRRGDPFGDRSIGTGSGLGTTAAPIRTPGPRAFADEPPRAGTDGTLVAPAGSSPLRPSPGSFATSTGNTLREGPGTPDSDRGFGVTPRGEFGGKKGDDPLRQGTAGGMAAPRDFASSPRELPSAPRAWDPPPRIGMETPGTLVPTGGLSEPAGRSGPLGRSDAAAPRRLDGSFGVEPNSLAQRAGTGESFSAPPGTRAYVVQPGDTIYDIARSELGSATRWPDIYELNRDTLGRQANHIAPGMRLLVPQESGGPGILTQRPASGYMK